MYLEVTVDDQGVPVVQVPSGQLWELVEHLSAQRLTVHYSYHGQLFEVRFPRMSVAEVQQTLVEWADAHTLLAA
jgi:hypothetical protein